jgi:hypothetical protein
MKTNGVLTQNHNANRANKVVNGIAAELLFAQRTKLRMKKSANTMLKYKELFIN